MAPTMNRLQLARRIHQVLVREIGHEIEVERLLAEPRYARDVLLVCDAVPGGELAPLADLFREATQLAASAGRAPGHAPQPNPQHSPRLTETPPQSQIVRHSCSCGGD